jgi:membrane-associated phospholipid phosphatase
LLLFIITQIIIVFAGWWLIAPQDEAWLREVRHGFDQHHALGDSLARTLSYWGDFVGLNLTLTLVLWWLGGRRPGTALRHTAVALLLAGVLAGVTTNIARFSFGRSRPNANAPDGFYGPRFESRFHAFPSAHTSTAFGAAIPLLISQPWLGVPVTIIAGGVSWSRMYRNQHRPTDIFSGIWVATLFGIPLGLAVRRLRRRTVNPASVR